MDAQAIELPDASVDGVISRFGVMLAPDPAQVFGEVRRVLRPEGRLAYAVIGPPDRNPWMSLLRDAFVRSGHPPPGDPFGPGGPLSLSAPERNRELLIGAGFSGVQVEEVCGLVRFDDLDDYWTLSTAVAGSIPALVRSLSAGEVSSVRASLEPTLAPFRSVSTYDIPWLAIGVRAT
jgi:SAM-dependent methyltransferase